MAIRRVTGVKWWIGLAIGAGALLGFIPRAEAATRAEASLLATAWPRPLLATAHAWRQPAQPATPPRLVPRRMRKNTISLGVQGQYGVLGGSSAITDGFDHGPGYAFRFRYLLSRRAALGLSLEHQRYGSREDSLRLVPTAPPDSHLVITTVALEAVQYFHRERDTHSYLLEGFGYASPDNIAGLDPLSGRSAGPKRINEGPFLVLGAGLEHFLQPRFSIDATVRGFAEIANSELTLATQVSLGIHLYPGD
jgi:hypothetical protein